MANFNSARNCGSTFTTTTTTSNSTCGCTETTADCGCGCNCGCERSTDCGCAVSESVLALDTTNTDACTCCKTSMREALKLLCCNTISDLVDFDAFAFISTTNIVGTTPSSIGEDEHDNLGELEGTFRRFSPCNCDLIDIEGTVFTPSGPTIEVDQASLCALNAIVFELLPAPEETSNGNCCEETDLSRFRRVRDLLQQALRDMDHPCGECVSHCDCTDDCCCTRGIVKALSNATMNKRTTLSAGLLSLLNVTALGTIGSVLVLGNEDQNRFYFVCANKVDFLV